MRVGQTVALIDMGTPRHGRRHPGARRSANTTRTCERCPHRSRWRLRASSTVKSGLVPIVNPATRANTAAHASDALTVIGRRRSCCASCRSSRAASRLREPYRRIGNTKRRARRTACHYHQEPAAARSGSSAIPGQCRRLECGPAWKILFLHKEVPDGWWEQHTALSPGRFNPHVFLARSSLASYTWTEVQRLFEPVGVDRWSYELALKYGMRDGLTCPVGGRWAVAFWSRRVLSNILTQPARIVISAAANFAAIRLEQLAGPDASRIGSRARLASRELAVLRLVSTGGQSHDIAKALGLGEETIRSHLKNAQVKLHVRNRTHAACEALRQNLIP